MQRLIREALHRRNLPAWLAAHPVPPSARPPSCAVVGSSSSLLRHRFGDEIDSAAVVVRTNQSPRKHVYAHVGRRTDVRVWGFIPLPRSNQYQRAEWVNDSAVADAFLIYCPPVRWLSECWREIARDGDPRLHPSAWRLAQRLIHTNRTRCEKIGCFPSTGAMAVLFALSVCARVVVYGFGDVEGGAPPCAHDDRPKKAVCR